MVRRFTAVVAAGLLLFLCVISAQAWSPVAVENDPLVRMPGTQPNQVTIEAPGRCLNCHAGYNTEVEPGFNWKGSMMAQASRDFLYWSCLAVAAQDSIWATGRPNATDICERCHFPKGWLEGRSDPTNATLMTGADYDGVQCDFCHTAWDPFFEATANRAREGDLNFNSLIDPNEWISYWDETNTSATPSQLAADAAYADDLAQSRSISSFNGNLYFSGNLPPAGYTENAVGQYFISANSDKRAPFADAAARHQMLYSRYHKSKYFCATCHDVSNPVLANLSFAGTLPGDGATVLPTEANSGFSYYHVERTFSEFMLSAYGAEGGADGIGPFAPSIFETSDPGNKIRMCQDCHMRDVRGVACNKRGVPVRPDESVEHPNSGQPLHDMTGGNAWVSFVLASAVQGSPNYDGTNDQLLNQGPAALTLDLTQGEGIDPAALLAGADRAKQQLLLAASITNTNYDAATGALSFRVQNQTGHKLISGFPEGRRMFVNVKAFSAGTLIHEVNPYDATAGTLKGLPIEYSPNSPPLAANESYNDELVYETHPKSDLTGEAETFHFALATGRYKDNRIPPKGFRIDDAASRLCEPVHDGTSDTAYFTPDEYAGGYDEVHLALPAGADFIEINLNYQTTSREYIEFLRDEINGTGNLTLSSPTPSGEPEAYVIQTDPFFSQLAQWGDTIWQLWTHNMDVDGARPFLMTQAAIGTSTPTCSAPTPTLLSAVPGNQTVTLTWSDESGDPNVSGYKVYYDQAGKAQFLADVGLATGYEASGLSNGIEYCYKVTSYYDADCESPYSNVLCATPENQGQTMPYAGVSEMTTGYYSGKGASQTFVAETVFNLGDSVVIRLLVVDPATGQPIPDATVLVAIVGPEATTISSSPSGPDGWAEVSWSTKTPNRKGNGGNLPGTYAATVKDVSVSGYNWDGVTTQTAFELQ